MKEKTLVLIKPDLVKNHQDINVVIDLVNMANKEGCSIINMKRVHMTKELVEKFYAEHAHKSFFKEISEYMTSGDIIALSIEGNNAISVIRNILGATNPEQANENTLRKKYGKSVGENGTHGSDSIEASAREHKLIF